MEAGDLRDRVVIQKRDTTADTKGGRATSWVDLVTESDQSDRQTRLPAKVRPLSTSERLQAASIGALLQYEVTLRYRLDVTEKMRALWTPYRSAATKTLEIHGVQPVDGGRMFVVLTCSEMI